jgi:hypothetical protein
MIDTTTRHDTTDDHGNKIPNISVNLQTNSTKDISTESQELYIKTDTRNEVKRDNIL